MVYGKIETYEKPENIRSRAMKSGHSEAKYENNEGIYKITLH